MYEQLSVSVKDEIVTVLSFSWVCAILCLIGKQIWTFSDLDEFYLKFDIGITIDRYTSINPEHDVHLFIFRVVCRGIYW